MTSTALGTILPVLRDSGDPGTRFGTVVMATDVVGVFGPIIAMAPLFNGPASGESTLLLAAFAPLTAVAVFWALRPRYCRYCHYCRLLPILPTAVDAGPVQAPPAARTSVSATGSPVLCERSHASAM